jgi:hypothetical protein
MAQTRLSYLDDLMSEPCTLPDLIRQTRRKSTPVALAYFRPADL